MSTNTPDQIVENPPLLSPMILSDEVVSSLLSANRKETLWAKRGTVGFHVKNSYLRFLNPTPSVGGSGIPFQNGNQIQFEVPPDDYNHTHHMVLDLTVKETSGGVGASISPTMGPFLFDRIEFKFMQGNQLASTFFADECYNRLGLLPTEDITTFASMFQLNMTAATYSNQANSISSGQSRTYSIPLLGNIMEGFNLSLLRGNRIAYITVFMRSGGIVSSVAGGLGAISNAKLWFYGENVTKTAKVEMYKYTRMNDSYLFNYPFVQRVTKTDIFTANQPYTLQLTGVLGICPVAFFFIRASESILLDAVINYTAISGSIGEEDGNIELLDTSNQNLLSTGGFTPKQLRGQYWAKSFSSTFASQKAVYYLPIGENPHEVLGKQEAEGVIRFTGNEKLRITFGAAFPTGTFNIEIYFYFLHHMKVHNYQSNSVVDFIKPT
jgi:hypothetical protein